MVCALRHEMREVITKELRNQASRGRKKNAQKRLLTYFRHFYKREMSVLPHCPAFTEQAA